MVTPSPADSLVHFVLSLIPRTTLRRGSPWLAAPCGHRSHHQGRHFVPASQFTAAQRAPPDTGWSVCV